jgi:hypothetical protein
LIGGPVCAIFDDRVNDDDGRALHMLGAKVFAICHILYVFILVQILNGNSDKFKNFTSQISFLNLFRTTVTIFAIATQLFKMFEVEGDWDRFLEWYAFLGCFLNYIFLI